MIPNSFLYFAYGSNMLTQRLRERVSSAQPITVASISGFRLSFHKPSTDGSGKCSIDPSNDADDVVWGVLFEIDKDQEKALDEFEGKGYSGTLIEASGFIDVRTYTANRTDTTLIPYHWYKDIVVAGAIQHNLPEEYVARICAVVSKDDPNRERDLEARRILESAGYLLPRAVSKDVSGIIKS